MIEDLQSDKFLTRTLFNNFGKLLVFVFYSNSNQTSFQLKKHLAQMIPLFGQFNNVKYFSISLEKCPQICKKYKVEYVPTTILTQTDKKVIKTLQIDDVGSIFDTISEQAETLQRNFQTQKKIWHPKIKSILSQSPVIIFIKGTAENPKCGFTQTLIKMLKQQNVQFTFYDILEDEYMRYWLRNYSGWATYPQIFIKGKLIGGLDVCRQLIQKKQFQELIPQGSRKLSPQQKFKALVLKNRLLVMSNGFSFEDKQIQYFITRVQQKFKGSQICVINVNLQPKMKEFLATKKINLPVLFVDGVVNLE